MAQHLTRGADGAERWGIAAAARQTERLIVRFRRVGGRKLDRAQTWLRWHGNARKRASPAGEYTRIGPMMITPERAAALQKLRETERV